MKASRVLVSHSLFHLVVLVRDETDCHFVHRRSKSDCIEVTIDSASASVMLTFSSRAHCGLAAEVRTQEVLRVDDDGV